MGTRLESLTVIIPCYFPRPPRDWIRPYYQRVADRVHEVILVDDASPYSLADLDHPRIRHLSNSKTMGPAFCRNRGAEAATTDQLGFLDADVYLPPELLDRVDRHFGAGYDAFVGQIDLDRPRSGSLVADHYNLRMRHNYRTTDVVDALYSSCAFIRRSVFEEVGGFDEGYLVPSVEDAELGLRLSQHGWAIRVSHDIVFAHRNDLGLGSLLRSDFVRSRDRVELLAKKRARATLGKTGRFLSSPGNQLLSLAAVAATPVLVALGAMWNTPALLPLGPVAFFGLSAPYFVEIAREGRPLLFLTSLVLLPVEMTAVLCGVSTGVGRMIVRRVTGRSLRNPP